ncbi:hypothetical protein FGW37_28740 [Streptomyces rectiverticillatus]|uniref:hypothetical protein n=1 Tax=Streptomyces rectiverticillatus TaxID=173860 RepID=UPI0015C3C852|nr:hypothetical protein [Streptomyces rectiverticillatus]QLE75058.1 hypothetical protein FGW37_28740 [Streptomyces rectiverticillatus]
METEEEIHRFLLTLGRDPGVLDGLYAMHEEPGIIDELERTRTPDSVLRDRGISLPTGATIGVPGPHRAVRVDATVNDIAFYAQWDLELGLSTGVVSGPVPDGGDTAMTAPAAADEDRH